MKPTFEHQTFTLVKFDPNDIVFLHNGTHQLYRYVEVQADALEQPTHHLILKATELGGGFIYQKELTTLLREINPRIESKAKNYFSQAELNNTFQPILLYLQKGYSYGDLRPQNILIDNQGNIRLKDPRLSKQQDTKVSTFERLGLIMLQCALLKSSDEVWLIQKSKTNLLKVMKQFSIKFIANLWILLNNVESMLNEAKFSQDQIQGEKMKKLVQELERIKLNSTSPQEKKDIFRSVQEKRIVVIPPLNLKFQKIKKAEIKVDTAMKGNYHHNQNENEESVPKTMKKTDIVKKALNFKCQTNKNIEQKVNVNRKKSQRVENYENSIKKKGKTVQKKSKFQERSN